MIIRLIKKFFAPSEQINLEDGGVFTFAKKILELQDRIEHLEQENIQLINNLYELENRIESKIYSIQPVVYNISTKNLED